MNPYLNRLAIMDDQDFFGRQVELQTIVSRISARQPQSVSIVGERRVGKSSLLRAVFRQQARGLHRSDEFAIVYMDLQGKAYADASQFFASLLEEIGLACRDVSIGEQPPTYASVQKVVASLARRHIKLILLFDEFEAVTQNKSFTMEFFAFLRSLPNNHPVSFVVTSHRDLQELCHSKEIAGSPFFNVFHRLSLSVFRPEEALELVEKPSLAAGCPLAPYAPSVFRMGGYFPFFLQLACCAFFEHCSSKPNHPAPDLTAVWGAFYDEARSHFEYVWDHLSDRERVVALKLSNRQRLEEADRPFLHSLVRRGYARDGENFLFSDVFDAFVQAKAIAESHPVSVAGAALTDANTPEQLLQERRRIDDILRERFLRQVAVLYVDVVGSTQFSENRGPVEAFNLIKRLEVLLQPIIRKHGGRVVKLAGDAVIARFDRAPDAVRAGMAVQKEMARHNARLSERDQTRVKVAINYGEAIEVESDVYGDAINAAERVLRETAPDEVLISEFVHRRLSATDAARFVEKGSFALKGKAEPVRLYSYQHQHQR